MIPRALAAVLFALAVHPALAHGQVFRGTVYDAATGAGVEGAGIEVLDVAVDTVVARATTGEAGRFSVYAVEPGEYRLRVSHLAFGTLTTTPHRLEKDAVTTVEIQLKAEPVELDPINVQGERLEPPYMRDVRYRIRQGWGDFLTREELAGLQGRSVAELLNEVPGVRVAREADGTSRVFAGRAQAAASGPCPAALYVNGTRQFPMSTLSVDTAGNIDDTSAERIDYILRTMAGDVEAVEVYRGAAAVPEMFSGLHAGCGVVAVWLRSGQSDLAERRGPIVRMAPPAIYVLGSLGSMEVSGTGGPTSGLSVDLGLGWLIGMHGQMNVNYRRTSHDGGLDPADEVRTVSLGVEPRYYIVTGPLRPFAGARGAWNRRTLRRPHVIEAAGGDIELKQPDFDSEGWSYGVNAGLSWRVGAGFFVEATAFWERSSFDNYTYPTYSLEGTASSWTMRGVRFGLSYLAIS